MEQLNFDMRLIWLLASLVVLASAGTLKDPPSQRYDNYSVYRLNIRNKIQLSLINKVCELNKKVCEDYIVSEFGK